MPSGAAQGQAPAEGLPDSGPVPPGPGGPGAAVVPAACAGRSAEAPQRTRVEGNVTEGVPLPRFQRVGSVAGVRDAVKGFEKTSLRARLRRRPARRRRVPARGGQRAAAAWGGPSEGYCGRRGVSVSLGRGRPRRGPKRWFSPSAVPPRLVGPAGCKQRPPSVCAGGALARGGLRFPFDLWSLDAEPRGLRASRWSAFAALRRPDLPTLRPGTRLLIISGLGKVCDCLWRELHRRGAGTEPPSSWARGRPPGAGRGRRSPDRARPTSSLLGT